MDVSEFLSPAAVFTTAATSRKQVLQEVAEKAAGLCHLSERTIFHTLLERERLGSTGVGRGIAIPHARFSGLDTITGMFLRVRNPVEFDAADGQPVDLLFVLLVPANSEGEHLRVMARISRLLRDDRACEKIRAAVTKDVIYALLTADDEINEHGL